MKTDHMKMLCEIGEISTIVAESMSIEVFLQKIVDMVADHMNTNVCSIYLLDQKTQTLVLKATHGLKAISVDNVKLKIGEGLVGTTIKEMKVIYEKNGLKSPNFKFFPNINEENYESFLSVPIVNGTRKIGVLVIQREKPNAFEHRDILAIRATASQLASVIENVRLMMYMTNEKVAEEEYIELDYSSTFIKGKSASSGLAIANSIVISKDGEPFYSEDFFNEDLSISDFEKALKTTESQLIELQKSVEERLTDAASLIFSTHLLMLKDQGFTGGMRELIALGENPVSAVTAIFYKYRDIFSDSPNEIIREKVQDIEDLSRRIISNLISRNEGSDPVSDKIVIARELFPSDLLKITVEGAKGVVLVSGGVTSHLSILARSLKLPMIFIDKPELLHLKNDVLLILDSEHGNLYIKPDKDVLKTFQEQQEARKELLESDIVTKEAVTADGTRINVLVNINLLSDLNIIPIEYVDGIGLYRSEFPFMIRNDFPTEEEQFFVYKKLIDGSMSKVVTFRTLDIGGDKVLSYYDGGHEQNPFLGMRSIRFSLTHPDIFREQIRAVLRAGKEAMLRIMFPMISGIDDFQRSRQTVFDCMDELRKEGTDFNDKPEIGMMVELPSAVAMIEDLALLADFLSIGSNDLIQYTLAVDRTNEKVAHLFVPHHPSVLRSLDRIVQAADKGNADCSICGDMGSRPEYIPFLLGIGLKKFSVDAVFVPKVKEVISETWLKDAEKMAEKMLKANTSEEIENIMKKV